MEVISAMRNLICNQSFKFKNAVSFCKRVRLFCAVIWCPDMDIFNKLEALEMWVYRIFLKIPGTDHINNNEEPETENLYKSFRVEMPPTLSIFFAMSSIFLKLIMEG